MRPRQTLFRAKPRGLPNLWLLSDERNDAALEQALTRLPRGSGFVFRHYHLPPRERRARFEKLARIAHGRGHVVILAGHVHRDLPRLATAHSLREIARANRTGTDAVLLSPVFPTRSHPGAKALGPLRFRLLAARAAMPVIALGGMNVRTARRLGWPRWAAIDGLS